MKKEDTSPSDLKYKSAFGPLIDALKNLKRASDINSLKMDAPIGVKPKGVSREDATDFAAFASKIKERLKVEKKKKKVGVKSILKELLKWSGQAAGDKTTTTTVVKKSNLPPYKKDYDPLFEAMKKIKKSAQIKSLSMIPPLGAIPAGVDRDVAIEFTSVFVEAVIKELKGGDKNKKVKMKEIRARIREVMNEQDVESENLKRKREYAPLIVALNNETLIKRKKDIASLSLGPPLGCRPKDVSQEIATEFVKNFIPQVWDALKKHDRKKTLKNLRVYINSLEMAVSTTKKAVKVLGEKNEVKVEKKKKVKVEVPEMDIVFIPLVDVVLEGNVNDLKDFSKLKIRQNPHKEGEGLLPRGVPEDVGKRFVDTFLPALYSAMESDQQDVTLSNIRARLLELTQIGDYDEDPETKRQNDILKYEHEVEDVMIMGMRKTFEKMCRGSSGVVSSKEIRRILEMHGQDVSRDDLSYILETFSEGRSDRYMDFLDFSLHLSNQMRTSDEPLNVIFDTINRDLSGELKRDQILRWTKMMDENVTKSEATLMLKKVWTKEDLRHVLTEREHDSRTDDYYETHKRTSQSSSTAKFVEKKSEVAPAATSDEKKKGEEDVRNNPKYSKYVKLIEMHATREQIQVKLKKDNPELNFKLLEPLFD